MRNRNYTSMLVICITSLLVAPMALADENTAVELTQINESIAILTAKQKQLDLQTQIAQKQALLSHNDGVVEDRSLPVVRGIQGMDGKLTATLAFGNGIQQTVKIGENIHGGYTIGSIGVNEVTLSRGKETFHLTFGREPASTQSTTAFGAGSSLPSGR